MAKKKTTSKKASKKKAVKKTAKKKAVKKKAVKKKKKAASKKKATKKKKPNKKVASKKAAGKKATKKKATKKKAAKKKIAKKKAAKKKAAKKKKAATKKVAKKSAAKPKTAAANKASAAPAQIGSGPTVLQSPKYSGRPSKLGRDTYPKGTGPSDFKCWGPPATVDGDFTTVRICDMGSFSQDGKDSNKYYHGAMVQDDDNNWYAYFEWGRTGATSPSFQFTACDSEASARSVFASQLHSKNDRRGEWVTIAGIRTLRARKGKDCYLVRPQATRSTGLPDARSIKVNDGAKKKSKQKSSGKKKAPSGDPQTLKLLQDLTTATIAYTRGSMADSSLPTQNAIEEAKSILVEAQKRLTKVKDSVSAQVKDKKLMDLTSLLYGRIPKKKSVGAAAETWVLSKDNILSWQSDLDAFESALYATDIQEEAEVDLLAEMRLSMEWVSPTSSLGKFLYDWWPKATGNRHSYIGKLKIKNLWKFERFADKNVLADAHKRIIGDKPNTKEKPKYQPAKREDLSADKQREYKKANTALLFHGTRSVNVSGILRESLRLPKNLVGVVITGAMFGPGLYFADDWKKSAGYTSLQNSYWSRGSGAVPGRSAFMFAADVVLGQPFVSPTWKGFTAPPKGHHSVYGKAGKAGLQNNEFIVYNSKQSQLRYLIEFSAT